ncbi:MAG TPA: hypothetical protein VL484_09545 [Vicinamibacterales bacterium]|jgi:hypothetical protein|nr:hypothetical protein [Vicinamibacterales bacterium]
MKGMESEIDRLYQLPLETFTAERNALAKRSGSEGARVRELDKPSVPAWAVNQLYWNDRAEWDALIAAADNLRRAHKAVLAGRGGDVRAAGTVHDEAVESALKAALRILAAAGHPATDSTKQGIVNTLRALPAEVQPGRLTKALQPGGFEMLAGLAIAGGGRGSAQASHSAVSRPRSHPSPAGAHGVTAKKRLPEPATKAEARALAAAKQEVASSERALREAEQAIRRDEFESARAAREERRAADAADKARDALARAKVDLERSETALAEARGIREAADTRVSEGRAAVKAAEKRAEAAAAALKKLSP